MNDYQDQAARLIRSGNVSADAAAVTYAILALAQAATGCAYCAQESDPGFFDEQAVITPNIKGDML